jgi:hypothetical protein
LANEFSFHHLGNESMASYRYRCKIPAEGLGVPVNEEADIYILSKPSSFDMKKKNYVADFCDDHFDWPHYQVILKNALLVTCPTEAMKAIIRRQGREAIVIPDPYEYPLEEPHCNGGNLLWYGHGVNIGSIVRIFRKYPEYQGARVVSNVQGAIPWSYETMLEEFKLADIVLMPATKEYKSPNRTIEAIRQGCFVVAEPHPSINDFPIFIGDIKEGVEWAKSNPQQANQMILEAQSYIERYSPKIVIDAWRKTLESASTLAQEKKGGKAG